MDWFFRRVAMLFLSVAFVAAAPVFSGEGGAGPGTRAGGALRSSPLFRTLTLNAWGTSLAHIARSIREQTGVEILFYKPDLPPEETSEANVGIVAVEASLGTVMEALARSFGFRFRVTAAGTVEVSRGYGWVGERRTLRFVRTPKIAPDGDGDGSFRALVSEMVKPLALLAGQFLVKFEPYPLPDRPEMSRGALVLPEVLAEYVGRGLACLAGEAGDYPDGVRDGRLFAVARDWEADWEAIFSRRVAVRDGGDVRAAAAAVAEQGEMVVVVRGGGRGEKAGLPDGEGRYGVGSLCANMARGLGMRRVFLACGAVVFEGGTVGEIELDSRSRELFWNGLAVAGFDVRGAVARVKGAEGLMSLLRRDVFPGVWGDSACSMTYSGVFGRLAVVAPLNVMGALAERIRELGGG